jgi:hypothetical protein
MLAHLIQCRPIDLAEGWDVAGDQKGGVIAKISCRCGDNDTSKEISYALQTPDIRQTCSEGDRLCDAACAR